MKIANLRVTLAIALVALLATPLPAIEVSGASLQSQVLTPGWSRISFNTDPEWRAGAAMTYDDLDEYVLLFGGAAPPFGSVLLNDSWAFQGGEWGRLDPSQSPSARSNSAMTYDAADGYVLLFGGWGYNGTGNTFLNDTWEFQHGEWAQFHPATSPSARESASMVYDSALQSVVLFGGSGPRGSTNDTWEFKGGEWEELHPASSPPIVTQPSFVFDGNSEDVLLFGGLALGTTPNHFLNETWTFNGLTWMQLHPTASPSNRTGASAAYDPAFGYVVLFGGLCRNATTFFDCPTTAWLFSGENWSPYTTSGPNPNSTSQASMGYDSKDEYVVLFESASNTTNLSTTWAFVGLSTPTGSSTFLGLPGLESYALLGGIAAAAAAVAVLVMTRIRRKGEPATRTSSRPEPRKDP